ncbi:MAG: DPP IV N-terminal domain-containing protein [Gemmatimonadales bacterium]
MTTRLILMLLAVAAVPLEGQPRGIDLFARMARGRLTTTTGLTRVRWLPSGEYLHTGTDSGGRVFARVDPRTEQRTPLLEAATAARLVAEYGRLSGRASTKLPFLDFEYVSDGRALRFAADSGQWLFDLGTQRLRKLAQPNRPGPLDFATTEPGTYSPDFRHYVFIRDYDNLFLLDTETGAEVRLTTGTSEDNTVGFLGATPWYVWSPDSRWIAYFKADQRVFPSYPFLRSLEPVAKVETMRYPFTMSPTAPMELWVVNVATQEHRKVAENAKAAPFLRDLVWWPNSRALTYQLASEFENRLELRSFDLAARTTKTLLVDEDPAFLDPPTNFRFLADGRRFLWSSERSGWRHLYLHDSGGDAPVQLTRGEWVTEDVVHVDERAGWIYFVGYLDRGLERHFFRVKPDGTGLARLTPEPGTHAVSLDPSGRYFTDDFSAFGTPRTVNLRQSDGRLVRSLATTAVDTATALGLQAPELLRFRTADGAAEMQGLLFKPVGFDSSRRYPVIVNIYGGPHTKSVRNSYETTDFRARIAQLGFLVVEFDGRGTRLAEKTFQAGNYLRLGQVDVDDQAAGIKQLAARPYVDASRVGVTGLSHGGFMTLMMMLRYPDVFQVGVAGVPLTDLALGPRQYIGRFMRTPEANPDGYAKANIIDRAGELRGRLQIYHGTLDRNAVIGNTMQLVKRFVELGKPVEMMIYPDGVHVLEGLDAVHQVKTMMGYFLEHLQPDGWAASRAALWAAAPRRP